MEKSSIQVVNQQERLSADLNWLAGVWESEGWFSIGFQKRDNCGSQYAISSGIVNTDSEFIEEAKKILSTNNIAHYVTAPRISGIGIKPKVQIIITGLKRNKKFLDIIIPYLRTKKKRAEIVKSFIDFRESREAPKTPYGEIENSLFLELRKLNNRCAGDIPREHT